MVYTEHDSASLSEAIRSAFRHYDISPTLTPKVEALVIDLDLVDVKSSSIRCQGRCVNGGTCSQKINQYGVMRAVLQLQIIASDLQLTDEKSEVWLGTVYAELLCGSAKHCTDKQIQSCVSKAKPVVEAWRGRWIADVPVVKQEPGERVCKSCGVLKTQNHGFEQQLVNVTLERDELAEKNAQLEKSRVIGLRCNEFIKDRNLELDWKRQALKEQVKELTGQLHSLQIRHDGLVGRMAFEVVAQQQSQSMGTPVPDTSEGENKQQTTADATPPHTPPKSVSPTPQSAGRRTSQFIHDTRDREFHRAADATFAFATSHFPAPLMDGFLGVPKSTKAEQHAKSTNGGMFTPEPTPERKGTKAPGGDVLFKSGPLQTPTRQGKGKGEDANKNAPPSFRVRKTE